MAGGSTQFCAVDVTDQEVVDAVFSPPLEIADDLLICVDVGGRRSRYQSGQSAGHEIQDVLIGSEGSDVLWH